MKSGFAAISTVLVISAVTLAVIVTTVMLSIGTAQSSLALLLGEGNLQQVEGCAEDLLVKVRDNPTFSAATINRPEGMCNITYNLGGPVNWDATVAMNQGDYVRKIRVVFVHNTTFVTLTSWQEI